jgi:CBS domain containing-hemolysin-like protein
MELPASSGLVRHLGEPPEVFRLQTLLRPVLVAPASKDADDLLDGLMRLSEFEELAGVCLDLDTQQVDTLDGLVMHRLGRGPSLGDELRLDGWPVRIEALDGRRVARVRVVPASPPPSPATAPDRA